MSNSKNVVPTETNKKAFNLTFDIMSKNSSKNFDYNKLYKFVAVGQKKDFLTIQEKKNLRKRLQNVDLDTNFIAVLIKSGFVADNKSKEKFLVLKPQVELFEKSYTI